MWADEEQEGAWAMRWTVDGQAMTIDDRVHGPTPLLASAMSDVTVSYMCGMQKNSDPEEVCGGLMEQWQSSGLCRVQNWWQGAQTSNGDGFEWG
jgi:hypothetical protein